MEKHHSQTYPHSEHWHFLRRRHHRKRQHTTREIFIGQLISTSGALIAGVVLELNKNQLLAMTGAFLILPGIFDVGGSIAGAMGARLNHHLQQSDDRLRLVLRTMRHSLYLLFAAGLVVAFVGAVAGSVLFDGSFGRIFLVAYLSVLIAGCFGLPIVAFATLKAYHRGLDPDNFIGPIETSVFDTLTILAVTMMVVLTS